MVACLGLVLGVRVLLEPGGHLRHRGHRHDDRSPPFLFADVAVDRWHWPGGGPRAPPPVLFLVVDLAFLGANIVKIDEGGWFPLAVAAAVFT